MIQAPSTTFLAGDSDAWQFAVQYADANQFAPISTTSPRTLTGTSSNGKLVERHLETLNTLFCDGHVKALKLDAFTALGTAPNNGKYKIFTCAADPD